MEFKEPEAKTSKASKWHNPHVTDTWAVMQTSHLDSFWPYFLISAVLHTCLVLLVWEDSIFAPQPSPMILALEARMSIDVPRTVQSEKLPPMFLESDVLPNPEVVAIPEEIPAPEAPSIVKPKLLNEIAKKEPPKKEPEPRPIKTEVKKAPEPTLQKPQPLPPSVAAQAQSASEGLELPIPLAFNHNPVYPPALYGTGRFGKVKVLVRVDESGKVDRSEIAESSGVPEFDHQALATIRQWRFQPGRRGGRQVPIEVTKTFSFHPNR